LGNHPTHKSLSTYQQSIGASFPYFFNLQLNMRIHDNLKVKQHASQAEVYYVCNKTSLVRAIYKSNKKQQIQFYDLHKKEKLSTVTSRKINELPFPRIS
jgi:hypothetical protein